MILTNNRKKEIVKTALQHSISFCLYLNDNNKIPDSLKNYFSKKINPNAIHDKDFSRNKEMYENINWSLLERNKALRIISRDVEILNFVNIERYKFSILELFPIFINHPDLIEFFIKDFENITNLEAIRILECNEDLIEKIDISKFTFNKKDTLQIINKFQHSERILERINLYNIDNYSTKKLIMKTGIDYIDRLNIKQLNSIDWLEILKKHNDLINFCDLSIFEIGDCYYLTKLIETFPDLDYLIIKNADKISALGWENLLKFDYEKYEKVCDWSKLTELTWKKLSKVNPDINIKKQKYFIF